MGARCCDTPPLRTNQTSGQSTARSTRGAVHAMTNKQTTAESSVTIHGATVYLGDNLQLIPQHIDSESVDLAYLDPPFNSAQKRLCEASVNGPVREYNDNFGSVSAYLEWIRPRLTETVRVLKPGGTLFLHCDWRSSHYLRIELDRLLGYDNFVNEIVWRRHTSHNDWSQGTKHFGRNADVILFYGKGARSVWNPSFRPYPQDYVDRVYGRVEPHTGRRYALSDLSGPGGAINGNPVFTFMGITRAWRHSKSTLAELQRSGLIVQTRADGLPRKKRYLDEMPGVPIQAIWDDVPCLPPNEREHYPTQKPLLLLNRIIQSSTRPGNIVFDPFCGSGTSLVAALLLQRRAIGIDSSEQAFELCKERLEGLYPRTRCEAHPRPA